MYSVLIVDDEDVIREGLKQVIDWQELGFSITSTAPNGEKALEILQTSPPDVILADVRMPKISGIELAEKVREVYPQIRVIILSGYDNFKFAQAAIRYGVYHYLLKPCQEEEIRSVFGRLKQELDQERERRTTEEETRRRLLRHEAEEVLQGERPPDQARTLLDWIERFTGASAAILHLWLCPDGFNADGRCEAHAPMPEDGDLETLLRGKSEIPRLIIVPTGRHQLGGILFASHESVDAEAEEVFEEIRRSLIDYGYCDIFGAYTSLTPAEGWLAQNHYENLAEAMRLINRRTPGELFHVETLPAPPSEAPRLASPAPLVQLICETPAGGENAVFDHLAALRDQFYEAENLTMERIEEWCRELTTTLTEKLGGCGIGVEGEIEDFLGAVETYRSCLTLESLFRLLRRLTESARRRRTERQRNALSKNVREALREIDTRYGENISLEEISRGLGLSAPYLSRLFKRELGVNFRDYLLDKRIEIARRMLTGTTEKVYAVAEAVGYPDQHYFSELFKRKTGFSPLEFRRLAPDGGTDDQALL